MIRFLVMILRVLALGSWQEAWWPSYQGATRSH